MIPMAQNASMTHPAMVLYVGPNNSNTIEYVTHCRPCNQLNALYCSVLDHSLSLSAIYQIRCVIRSIIGALCKNRKFSIFIKRAKHAAYYAAN